MYGSGYTMCHVLDREVREGSHINYGLVSHEVGGQVLNVDISDV